MRSPNSASNTSTCLSRRSAFGARSMEPRDEAGFTLPRPHEIHCATHVSLTTAGLCSWESRVIAASGDDLEVFIRAHMESAHIPGLALAIVRDGQLMRAEGFGFANLAQRRPMQAD